MASSIFTDFMHFLPLLANLFVQKSIKTATDLENIVIFKVDWAKTTAGMSSKEKLQLKSAQKVI